MKPGDKATVNNSHEEIVKAYNSLCDEYYRLVHGPSDSKLWHDYMCASIASTEYVSAEDDADVADHALKQYKKRW